MWVLVSTTCRDLKLGMEERPPIRRVAKNMLTKQSRTADKGCSSSLGFRQSANDSSQLKRILLRNSLGPGLIFCCDENGALYFVRGMLGACTGQAYY